MIATKQAQIPAKSFWNKPPNYLAIIHWNPLPEITKSISRSMADRPVFSYTILLYVHAPMMSSNADRNGNSEPYLTYVHTYIIPHYTPHTSSS